jgi:hypothetical protein
MTSKLCTSYSTFIAIDKNFVLLFTSFLLFGYFGGKVLLASKKLESSDVWRSKNYIFKQLSRRFATREKIKCIVYSIRYFSFILCEINLSKAKIKFGSYYFGTK